MISFRNKGSMTVLLAAALMFSQCKKDEQAYTPEAAAETEAVSAQLIAATSATTTVPQAIDATKATSDGGYAWRLRNVAFGVTGDSGTNSTVSTVRIFENGVEIGPAHAVHADIRNSGKGRFSHWGTDLYFSASDNSNPTTNGRKYTFLTTSGNLTSTTPTAPTTSTSSDALALSNLIGYANVDGKTTGGQGGSTVTVTTLSALKSAVGSTSPMIIKVSGAIRGTGYIDVKSNKTIVGVNGASVEGVSFHVMNVSNVIIQNLTIKNTLGDDCISIKYAHHIWVDHCDLSQQRGSDWEQYDGLVDITRRSNNVTLSWNRMHDAHKAVLIGADDANTDDIGLLKVTLYKNYFLNISERQPCARFGYIHTFNNYHKWTSGYNGYAVASTMGATVRTDNNYFEGLKAGIRTDFNAKPGYVSGASTNKYVSCGSNYITTSASSWTPASIYSYSSAVIPADQVPSVVLAGAGPR